MKKIAIFIGTRPEGIKMAPVIKALQQANNLEPIVVSTGQHKEMLDQVIKIFDLHIDFDLKVMQPNQTLASLSASLMTKVDALLDKIQPDMALVQGDTTTVLMAALACFYRQIPVGHVEAGLRTNNMLSPFPEEANRRTAAPIMALHFPPTPRACDNLIKENIAPDIIHTVGNTVIDALFLELQQQKTPEIQRKIDSELHNQLPSDWRTRPYILITGHRRENFGKGFADICSALRQLADKFTNYRFIYPVHLNPNVQEVVYQQLAGLDNIHLIKPAGYRTFVALMANAHIILTDSGGVQEEAPSLGKPVLVMRDTTERPEGIEAGTVQLVGTDPEAIVNSVSNLIEDESLYRSMATAENPYGDGQAAGRIIKILEDYFQTN